MLVLIFKAKDTQKQWRNYMGGGMGGGWRQGPPPLVEKCWMIVSAIEYFHLIWQSRVWFHLMTY